MTGLADLYTALYIVQPSSPKRDYWRGRIDEFIAQNCVAPDEDALARAQGVSRAADSQVRTDS